MKSSIIMGLLFILAFAIYSFKDPNIKANENSADGIDFFKGTFEEALEKAKKENKPIFLDVFASWCGPCKMPKKHTFSDKEVGDY